MIDNRREKKLTNSTWSVKAFISTHTLLWSLLCSCLFLLCACSSLSKGENNKVAPSLFEAQQNLASMLAIHRIPEVIEFNQSANNAFLQKATKTPQRAIFRTKTPQTETLRYKRWHDPNEDAFSLEVPIGWKVNGGMYHPSPIRPKMVVESSSPKKDIFVLVGDKDEPTYVYGNVIVSTGFKPGDLYSPDGVLEFTVMPYITSQEYAQLFVKKYWESECDRLKIELVNPLTSLSRMLTEKEAEMDSGGVITNVDMSEVYFTCTLTKVDMQGYFVPKLKSQAAVYGGVGGIMWWLDGAYGFLATKDKTPSAVEVLTRMTSSVQLNPKWLAEQMKINIQAAEQISEHIDDMNQIISDSWRKRSEPWFSTPTPIP